MIIDKVGKKVSADTYDTTIPQQSEKLDTVMRKCLKKGSIVAMAVSG